MHRVTDDPGEMKLKRSCSKKYCDNIAQYQATKTGFYCSKHYRFRRMRNKAVNKRKFVPTWEECEILLFVWCPTFCCPICNKKLEWHTNASGLKNVISLQHNNNGMAMLICQGCNAAHGPAQLGDGYFKIPKNYKYCSVCKDTLSIDEFQKNNNSRDGCAYICRQCNNTKSKIRYYGDKKT